MSENNDFTPELTLTPDLSTGAAAAQAPRGRSRRSEGP